MDDFRLNKDDAGYAFPSPQLEGGVACAECVFFQGNGMCHVVRQRVAESGYCNFFFQRDEANESLIDDIVEFLEMTGKTAIEVAPSFEISEKTGAVRRMLNKLLGSDTPATGFKALGDGLWFAAFTNNLEDRDKEIFESKAHDRYVARVHEGMVEPPELWLWHDYRTKCGQAITVDKVGDVVFAVGRFDDTEIGRAVEKAAHKYADELELSHQFLYPTWALVKDGAHHVYKAYNTFEVTIAPKGKGINEFTNFASMRSKAMPLNNERRAFYEKMLGKEKADEIEKMAEASDQALKSVREKFGVNFKAKFGDFVDLVSEEEAASEIAADAKSDDAGAEAGSIEAGFATALEQILEGQAQLTEAINAINKGNEQRDAVLEKALKAFTERKTALDAEIKAVRDLTPTRVDASESNTLDDDTAQEITKKMQEGAQKTYLGIPVTEDVK